MNSKHTVSNAFLVCALVLTCPATYAVDATSLEIGIGEKVKMVRAGIQWNWNKRWWRSHGTHIGGYWNATAARWRGTNFQGTSTTQNITSLGITPVFRFQNDSLKGFYVEGGIGAHILSERYDNDGKQLSTLFQFGDHLGIGYVFQNNLDVGLSIQHFSNGGIKKPNDGVNFAVVRMTYQF